MDLSRSRYSRWLYSLCLMVFIPLVSNAQLELDKPDIWTVMPTISHHTGSINQPKQALIGNHRVLPHDSVQRVFKRLSKYKEKGHSLFMVVRPLYNNPSGKIYFRYKGLEINDSKILYRGAGREFQPSPDRPLILSASFPAHERRGGKTAIPDLDSTLFEVAEIVFYNRFLSKSEMRLMETYLSLKYSIPTTENEDKVLRSYPTDSSAAYYWSPSRDRVYDREVIALGSFPFSGLQQTQTVAYHDDSLIIALDEIVPLGQMPIKPIQESSFLVMSKRINQSSVFDCELHLNQQFPITAWRLRTQNFQATADSLRIYYPNHQQSTFNDTLILTDGIDTLDLRALQMGSDLSISLALSGLKANRVYRFRVRSNACNDTASISMTPQGSGLMALKVDPNILPLEVEVSSIQTENQYDTIMYENPLMIQSGGGQYNVWLRNEEGALQSDFLIAGNDSAQEGIRFISAQDFKQEEDLALGQKIVVYPNPGFSGEKAQFEFHGFPMDDNLDVQVFDPQGRLIHQENLLIQSDLQRWEFTLGIPGSYNFTFRNKDKAYNQKLIAKKRF